MALSALAKKLRLQGVSRALILNPPEGYLEALGELPSGLEVVQEPVGQFDFVQVFVKDRSELDQFMAGPMTAVGYDALLWISYPKGSSGVKTDLNRDKLWEAVVREGIRPVAQVSVDQVWSAVRLRPSEKVGR